MRWSQCGRKSQLARGTSESRRLLRPTAAAHLVRPARPSFIATLMNGTRMELFSRGEAADSLRASVPTPGTRPVCQISFGFEAGLELATDDMGQIYRDPGGCRGLAGMVQGGRDGPIPSQKVRYGLVAIQLSRNSTAEERNPTSRVLDRRQRRGVPSARGSAGRQPGLASATPWVLAGHVEVLARSLRGLCDVELLHPRAKRARIDA